MFQHSLARRFAHAVFALLSSALIAAPAAASQYLVSTVPMAILPPLDPHVEGQERTVVPGDLVMSAPLGWLRTATLAQDITVEIAGLTETMIRTSPLLGVVSAGGGDLASLSPGAPIYCGELRINGGSLMGGILSLGLSDLRTRVTALRRFCLVDGDVDGRFERAFLVGAKHAEDQHMVEIAPVSYTVEANRPIGPDARIEVHYSSSGLFSYTNFPIISVIGGTRENVNGLATSNGRSVVATPALPTFHADHLPQSLEIGSAALTVLSFDARTRAAHIRYDHDFRWTPVVIAHPGQMIYVPRP